MKLLLLPSVVRQEILIRMGFIELLDLSTVSKKMKPIVKRDVKVRNHRIRIVYHQSHFQIHFLSPNEVFSECICVELYAELKDDDRRARSLRKIGKFNEVVSKFSVGSGTVHQRQMYKTSALKTYWNDPFNAMKEVLKVIDDVFLMRPQGIEIDVAAIGLDHQAVLSWVYSLEKPLEEIAIFGGDSEPEVCEWILEHPMTASEIYIESKSLTDVAIGNHLRRLKTGFNPNLKVLKLKLHRIIDREVVFNGLELTKEEGRWSFQLDNGDKCSVGHGLFSKVIRGIQILIERK